MANGVESDFKAIEKSIKAAIELAIPQLEKPLKDALRTYIETYVYDAYEPKVYERRSDYPSYGTPLSDVDENTTVTYTADEISLDYWPSGRHYGNPEWGERSGNELIYWIEDEHTIGNSHIPARPFWTNFEEDVEESAEALLVGYMGEVAADIDIAL